VESDRYGDAVNERPAYCLIDKKYSVCMAGVLKRGIAIGPVYFCPPRNRHGILE